MSLEYYAGLFDGEGCFSISLKLRYHKDRPWLNIHPMARIGMKNQKVLLTNFRNFFDVGKIYVSNKNSDKEIVSWQTTRWADAKNFAKTILPYLKVKNAQAEKMIQICNLYTIKRGDWKRQDGIPSRPKEAIIKIIETSLNLNPDSLQSIKRNQTKPMSYWIKIIDEIYGYRAKNPLDVGGMPRKYTDEQILKRVRVIINGKYTYDRDRKTKALAKYRFGSWEKAVELANRKT